MTAPAFAFVNDLPVAAMLLHVTSRGAWFADIDLEDDGDVAAGACVLLIGDTTLRGSVMPDFNGTRGLQRKLRIIGGGGGWGTLIAGKGYHNDAGIKAVTAARDVALAVGESFGALVPEKALLGVDYIRRAGLASRALEEVIGNVPWYVDYSGLTQVGARAGNAPTAEDYEVLEYNPRTHVAELAVDSLAVVGVGSVISARLDTQETIQSFDLELKGTTLRMIANCGVTPDSTSQIENLVRKIIERATDGRLLGPFRYRVISMNSDGRVNLQAVSKRAGVPDALLVEQWPGLAGAHAELTPGALVVVEFADGGDPTLPIITQYQGKQGPGYVPVSLSLCGGDSPVGRQGDLVQSGGVGTIVTLTPAFEAGGSVLPAALAPCVGLGLPYLISFSATPPTPLTADPLYGAIDSGSPKVSSG